MKFVLAIMTAVIGLTITGLAAFVGWRLFAQRGDDWKASSRNFLTRWNVLDYMVLGLFLLSMLLLAVDTLVMLRDQANYPEFHIVYTLIGLTFSFVGMVFMIVRLALTLSLSQSGRGSTPNHHRQPDDTH
ncbi:DUF1418 family protein [Paenibacillus sp. y28]|uniref:DUF1418 family protein n=1 Tax=Paenibacillus sp. y28 TaxID=3129110 RepID=UPI0030159E9B